MNVYKVTVIEPDTPCVPLERFAFAANSVSAAIALATVECKRFWDSEKVDLDEGQEIPPIPVIRDVEFVCELDNTT